MERYNAKLTEKWQAKWEKIFTLPIKMLPKKNIMYWKCPISLRKNPYGPCAQLPGRRDSTL